MDEKNRNELIVAETAFQNAEQGRIEAYDEYEAARKVRDLAFNERQEIIDAALADGVGRSEIAALVPDMMPRSPRETRSVVFDGDGVRDAFDPGTYLRWVQVADAIAEDIRDGIYPYSSLLPTLDEMRARYGASQATIRHGLEALGTQNLVVRRGRRRFVRTDPP